MTMIEKVARSLAKRHMQDSFELADDDKGMMESVEENWHRYVSGAKAAIEAMREPTECMINARFNNLGKGGKSEYEAMIDAALTHSTPK